MAVTWLCGFEMGSTGEGTTPTGAVSVQSSVARTGTYALRINPTGTTASLQFQSRPAAGGTRSLFTSCRFALRVSTLPGAATTLFSNGSAQLRLNSTGNLIVRTGGIDRATSTDALSADGLWHMVEFDVAWNAGSGARVYVDGNLWATSSVDAIAAGVAGTIGTSGVTCDLYVDDLVFEDGPLSVLWGAWKVPILLPTSDNSRGNWTGGAGGTTSLFDAINNQPPVGVAAGSDTNTSQIQNATNATYPTTAAQAGDFNCQTYAAAGIVAADTLWAVQMVCNHGEGSATGTKAGGLFIASNPAQASPGLTFDYGDDIGAAGTFPTNWKTAIGPVTAAPSVTLATAPVARVYKNDASTREGHVDFAGIYVAYTPATGQDTPELYGRPYGRGGQVQMQQLLAQ